jgi:hypothetical protein
MLVFILVDEKVYSHISIDFGTSKVVEDKRTPLYPLLFTVRLVRKFTVYHAIAAKYY